MINKHIHANQSDWIFFEKKRNISRRIPLFIFTKITRRSLNYLLYHTHVPCRSLFLELPVEGIFQFDSPTEQLVFFLFFFCFVFFQYKWKALKMTTAISFSRPAGT